MHTDPEVLALVALGERDAATPEELDHIAHCDSCGRDVDELEHLTSVGRTISDHFTLETPSPEVWNRIRVQLGFQDDFSSELVPPPVPHHRAASSPATPSPVIAAPPPDHAERAAQPRRRRRIVSLALAAVLALLAGVGGTLAWQQLRPFSETVLASTALDALPDWTGATGKATLEEDAAGRKVLVVTMVTPRPVDGIQQVWLIDRDVAGMIPVGQLTAPVQRFPLAADVDVSRFPVVDISVEAPDGDAQHSGDSIVRGTLPT
jgi:hypothetical protein